MKRELGSLERALVTLDRYAPFHSVYVLRIEAPPPRLGEHTKEILLDAGYSEEEIAELKAKGVV